MRAPIQYTQIRMEEILQKLPDLEATKVLSEDLGRFKRFLDPIYIAVVVGSSILGWVFNFFRAPDVKCLWQERTRLQDIILLSLQVVRQPKDPVCYRGQASPDPGQPHCIHQKEYRSLDGLLQH